MDGMGYIIFLLSILPASSSFTSSWWKDIRGILLWGTPPLSSDPFNPGTRPSRCPWCNLAILSVSHYVYPSMHHSKHHLPSHQNSVSKLKHHEPWATNLPYAYVWSFNLEHVWIFPFFPTFLSTQLIYINPPTNFTSVSYRGWSTYPPPPEIRV